MIALTDNISVPGILGQDIFDVESTHLGEVFLDYIFMFCIKYLILPSDYTLSLLPVLFTYL